MKLNMHNIIASAILCTALLVSFCNAYPYPVYWDREAFLEQLQQEERVGTDVEARIEQGKCTYDCPSPGVVFISNESDISRVTIQRPQSPINTPFNYDCNFLASDIIGGIRYIFSCYTPCPVLSISNGVVVEYHGINNKLEPRDPDTTATYSCSGDYTLVNERKRTRKCSRNGEWLGEAPKCILQCPELQDIPNGFVNFASRKPGATARYSCMEGYDLSGAKTRTCGEDGRWSGQEPTCESTCEMIQMCPKPITVFNTTNTNPSNIRILVDFNTSQVLGSEFDYKCQSGFVLFVSKNGGAYERASSDSITYKCQIRSTGSTFNRSIRANGQPKCFPLCPIPSLRNGEVRHGNREPGDIAAYSCRRGFKLIGPEERMCRQNGTWSGKEPFCKIIVVFCPLDPIPNEDTDPTPAPPPVPGPPGTLGYEEGTVITYTCPIDYELQGESERICLENGTFNHPRPFCTPTKCHPLNTSDIPNNDPEVRRRLLPYTRSYGNLVLFKPYFNRAIEGHRFEGSKAYLKCVNGWKLMEGTPAVQTCVRENGALVWTKAGTCVFTFKKIKYAADVHAMYNSQPIGS